MSTEPESRSIDAGLLQQITSGIAWNYRVVPFNTEDGKLFLYCREGEGISTLAEELEVLLGKVVELHPLSESELERLLVSSYRKSRSSSGEGVVSASGLNVRDPHFLRKLVFEAHQSGSSDIHLEIYDERCRVRFRIDGLLMERYHIGKAEYPALVNQIKIQANLDISEKRLPQDGRLLFSHEGERFDVRVSVLPTIYGEKVVMRLLSRNAMLLELMNLGFKQQQLDHYLEAIKRPIGLVLISGPTGSGKTTTLYATLKLLNQERSNILTIEDPIEYTLDGVNQVQLKESIGLTFGSALRTFLRQDPDIIMLGEIRDADTAQMAVRSALTGHLIFSTLHTNSAWGIVARLLDMGIPPYLLSGTVNLTMAQRLVRLLCPECKKREVWSNALYPRSYKPVRTLHYHYTAVGCPHCYYTGYSKRRAIYEVIPVDSELSGFIRNANMDVTGYIKEKGYLTLSDSAFEMLENGETSIEEVYPIFLGL